MLDRYTCCHKGHGRCTDTCLRSRTVGFKCLRYSTDRIWELFFAAEAPEQELSLPVRHDRSHDVPVLWMVLSHLRSRTGSCSGAYISLLFQTHQVRQVSVPRKAEPECVMVQICVCPRVNIAEPCTLGMMSTLCCQRTDLV